MDIQKIQRIRELYSSNKVVSAICDDMALRERNQSETKIKRMMTLLKSKGSAVEKTEVIAAFRELEDCSCGQYIVGRHGWPSRFVWSVSSLDTCKAARGISDSVESIPETDDVEGEESETTTHCLRLRDDFRVEVQLPEDLTTQEAERLCSFISALPIDE